MKKQVCFILATIFLVSFISAGAFPVFVKPLSNGEIVPHKTFNFYYEFSTTSDCSNVIYTTETKNVQTDDSGIGYMLFTLPDNLSSSLFVCEYRNGEFRASLNKTDIFADNLYAENIYSNENLNVSQNVTATKYFGELNDINSSQFNYQNGLFHAIKSWWDDLFVNEEGDTITGDLNITGNLNVSQNSYFNNITVNGDVWVKDENREWHHLEQDLTHIDSLFDAMIPDEVDISITNDGTTSTLFLTQPEGKEIQIVFNKQTYSFGTNETNITLTSGTNSSPTTNHIVVELSGTTPILVNYENHPIHPAGTIDDHSDIITVNVGDNGVIIDAVYNIYQGSKYLHNAMHVFKYTPNTYVSGFDANISETTFNHSIGTFINVLTEIRCQELSMTEDGFFYVNSSGQFIYGTDLSVITEYSDGTSFTNKFMPLVAGVRVINTSNCGLVFVPSNYPGAGQEYVNCLNAEEDSNIVRNVFPADTTVKQAYLPTHWLLLDGNTDEFCAFKNGEFSRKIAGDVTGGGGAPTSPLSTHSSLENLNWSSAGHIFDINLDMNNFNITNISRVGIGTSNPTHKLNVVGNVNITNNLTIGTNQFIVDPLNNKVGVNTAYADIVDSFTITDGMNLIHTATLNDDHAFEIDLDANGFGDVKALDIFYKTGAITTGQDEEAILVNFDEFLATGGDLIGLEVITTEGGADKIIGLEVGALVSPIEQLSGVFSNMDSADNNGVDNLAEFISTASDVAIFTNDNDYVIIGDAEKFEEIEFILDTTASGAGISPTFEFSTGVGTWTEFNPTDGTNAMKNNGVILWLDSDIPTWAVGTGSEYLIRITRTRNVLTTTPIEDKVQIVKATEYYWNEEGNLLVNEINASIIRSNDWSNVSGISTYNATYNAKADYQFLNSNFNGSGNFTTTGNIGIGTASPRSKLTVVGDVNITSDLTVNDTFYVDTTNKRIGVGISPQVPLHVNAGDSVELARFTSATGGNGVTIQDVAGNKKLWLRDASGNIDIALDTVSDSYFNGGNVGIGTSSPSQKLDVNGAITLTNNQGYRQKNSTGSDKYLMNLGTDDKVRIFSHTGNQAITIDKTTENVGIGTASPVYKLEVVGDATTYLAKFFNDGNNANRQGLLVQAGADNGVGQTFYFTANDGDGNAIGYIEQTAGSVFRLVDVSDERTKTNIVESTINGTEIINSIPIKNYNKFGSEIKIDGLVAQDVLAVYPQAVSEFDKDGETYYGISKTELIVPLMGAIQELKAENDLMKSYLCNKLNATEFC